jgi:hypothetical protein
MKEIELSFTIRIRPSQTDVHWIEEELWRLWEEVFLRALERVMMEIEREVLKGRGGVIDAGCYWWGMGERRRGSRP